MDKKSNFNAWYVVIAVLAILIVQAIFQQARETEPLPYSQFRAYLEQGKVDELVITESRIVGTLKEAAEGEPDRFVTTRVEPEFAQELEKYGVEFRGGSDENFFTTLLSWVLPALIFFGIWIFLLRRMSMGGMGAGGLMSIGKSRAKIYVEKDTKTTLADVAGVDEAKAEVQEIIDFLKDPQGYGTLGARLPRGVLLVGPPGTGKTLLARAVAGEAGVTFLSISGSEFVEMFVGVGAARVRDLFEQARKMAPCIIFIDELDAMGRARGAGPMAGGHDEKEQTLNQLLVELDGFDPSHGIILLAATNRPEILDPALLRPGRFDRQILVDRPDKQGRIQILRVHAKKIKLAQDVSVEQIAALTPGFTGADLANLVNEAALLATRRRAQAVTMEDFNQAIERIVAGLEKKNRLLNPKERQVVAYHELGHALVALTLPGVDPVHKISIIPRGVGALGYTLQRPTEDRFLMTSAELENKMTVLLGGRAAEELVFGEISTGAADDGISERGRRPALQRDDRARDRRRGARAHRPGLPQRGRDPAPAAHRDGGPGQAPAREGDADRRGAAAPDPAAGGRGGVAGAPLRADVGRPLTPRRSLAGLGLLLALGACSALDAEQARLCERVIPGIEDAAAGIAIEGREVDRAAANAVLIRYRILEPQGASEPEPSASRWLSCRFGGRGFEQGRLRLVGVVTDREGALSDIQVFFLRRYWLGLYEGQAQGAGAAQPAPWQSALYALQLGANALTLGCLYGLLAIGYTLVYAIVGRINLAFGEIAMVGAYSTFIGVTALALLGGGMLPLALLAVLALVTVVGAVHGLVTERLVFRPLRALPSQAPLIATIG
ncbi:MAG: Cell division protein FtsH, partial [Geminicoccaceae bacterium]|nr:Cell division protein FtsH [Geminicoccaceae bacterium]